MTCAHKDKVELRVEFEPNSKIFQIHWDVVGVIRTGKDFSSIVIPKVEKDLTVSARVYNSVGSAMSHGTVTVTGKFKILFKFPSIFGVF